MPMNDESRELKTDRLKEALLAAKLLEKKKRKRNRTVNYDKRFNFKVKGNVREAFKKYAKSKGYTAGELLRLYMERVLRDSGFES